MPIREANYPALQPPRVVFMSGCRSKSAFFHVSGPVGGPPGVQAWVKIRFFWPKMWGIMLGVTTNFNLEDWWTLERARLVLLETVKIPAARRTSRFGFSSRLCLYLEPRWEYLKNSFTGR